MIDEDDADHGDDDASDDDPPQVKEKSDSARKSGRANKGKNSRLERADEVVEMPQAKVGNVCRDVLGS